MYNKDYLLLIYTFMGMIILCWRIHLSFQSHQMCTFSVDLGMVRNRDGLSSSCIGQMFYAGVLISLPPLIPLKGQCRYFDQWVQR